MKKVSSTQEITKCLNAIEIQEDIIHTFNDPYHAHYPEDYKVVRTLYDIFTCGDEQYMMILFVKRVDMRDSFIDDFSEERVLGKSFF